MPIRRLQPARINDSTDGNASVNAAPCGERGLVRALLKSSKVICSVHLPEQPCTSLQTSRTCIRKPSYTYQSFALPSHLDPSVVNPSGVSAAQRKLEKFKSGILIICGNKLETVFNIRRLEAWTSEFRCRRVGAVWAEVIYRIHNVVSTYNAP